jgi:phospholipid transport system substrate-binding protein
MLKKLLFIIAVTSFVYANEIDDIQKQFEITTNKIIEVVKNKKLTSETRNDTIVKIITPMFDFKLMAKLSLSKKWKTMAKDKQDEFIKLYVKRMKKSYSSKVDKYTDEKIVVNSIKQLKKTRVVLNTNLVGADDNLEVVYKFYKPKKQAKNKELWLAYDVVIDGVSIIKTDKAQFKAVLQESSIDVLMDKLRK